MKVIPQSRSDTKNKGRIKRSKEIPEDLMATNSKLSPRLPNVIIEESKIAIGIASISRVALMYQMNFPIVQKSSPLPTRSSIYFHNVCIKRINSVTKNVAIKGPKKDFIISLSNFFIIPGPESC